MRLKMGDYNTLEVLKETDIAYTLSNGDEEIFLHKKQATRKLEDGEQVEVFLYFDNQKRITATMNKPILDQDTPAFAEVVGQNFRLGVFLDVGLIKDLLLSRDDMPFIRKEWPKEGDKLFVRMRVSKNQLTAKIIPRYEIASYLKPDTNLEVGEKYEAYNVYKTEEGNVFFTEQGHYIYVYFKHMRRNYRLGEKAEIKITIDKENYKYNGTLIEQKELMIDKDSQYLINYMKSNRGEMPYGDKSSADKITEVFNMSKKSFKRALGTLYKEKLVVLEPERTTLVKDIDKK